MVDYSTSLLWLALWPAVLYIAYRLSIKNALKEQK